MLQLSLSTGALYHLPLRTTFDLAREAGFDGVELDIGLEAFLRRATHVRRLSQDYGLPIFSIHPPIVPYPGMRNAARVVPYLAAFAAEVDARLIVLHTPKTTRVESIEWQRFVQAVLQERQRADSAVQVSLENGSLYRPGDNVYLLHDLQRLRDFAERYDLALTFDTSHAASSTNPLLEAFQLVSKRVVNIHFSDVVHRAGLPNWPVVSTVLRHHQMPGSGLLPLAELLRQALHSSYDGLCTLEVSPIAIQAWSLARVRQGLADVVRFIRGVEGDGPSAA